MARSLSHKARNLKASYLDNCVKSALDEIDTVKEKRHTQDYEGRADWIVTLKCGMVVSIEVKNWTPKSRQRPGTVFREIYTKWFKDVGSRKPTWQLREDEKDTLKVLVIPRVHNAVTGTSFNILEAMGIYVLTTFRAPKNSKDPLTIDRIQRALTGYFLAIAEAVRQGGHWVDQKVKPPPLIP